MFILIKLANSEWNQVRYQIYFGKTIYSQPGIAPRFEK